MKLENKYLVISDPVTKTCLNVMFGYSFEELNKFLTKNKRKTLDKQHSFSFGVSWEETDENDGTPYHAIWIKSPEWSLKQQGVIGHELIHSVLFMCENKGIEIIKDSPNEYLAYLWEYYFLNVCRKLADFLEKPKKRKRHKK